MLTLDNVVFAGCSFTSGFGLDPEGIMDNRSHPDLWVNLCGNNIEALKNLELINIGMSGASNSNILINVIDQLSKKPPKFLICQWTTYPRYLFKPDFEIWSDRTKVMGVQKPPSNVNNHKHPLRDVLINGDQKISHKYIENIRNKVLVLHHHHYEICNILHYINIIHRICTPLGTRAIHINGLCAWDDRFFERITKVNCMPEDYTDYTKQEIIRLDYRTDQDAHTLYNLAHDDYEQLGGIRSAQWVNLYSSFIMNRKDLANDGLHPGPQSNFDYFQMVKFYFDNQKIM